MYIDSYSDELARKLAKLRKRDAVEYAQVRKRMDLILNDPNHRYKYLTYDMKGLNRVHLGHFVLVFRIDHEKKTVSFEDYDHHDNIYSDS
jgi:mRNA-degrading endonuclease RelE of RelBE toxin-antitoxin system